MKRVTKRSGMAILLTISDLKNKLLINYKRQGRTLYNYQEIIPKRRYNNCKYRSISISKANANAHKKRNSNTIIVDDFNTPLTPMTDYPDRKLIRKTKLKITH